MQNKHSPGSQYQYSKFKFYTEKLLVIKHCFAVHMDSLEEGRHKEVRKLKETTVDQILGWNLKVTSKITSNVGGKIHGFSEKSLKGPTQPDITLAKEKSICSQKNWFGSKDSVAAHDFRRANAAFNYTQENTG